VAPPVAGSVPETPGGGGVISPQPGALPPGGMQPGAPRVGAPAPAQLPQAPGLQPSKQNRVTAITKPVGLDPLLILQERENR